MTPWWQRGSIYQIVVSSFQDSNDDGYGDLPGILSHIDYFAWLGVSAIWLSPIFASPMKELGYDVSDYTSVNPLFGTLDDFDALVAAAHERHLRLILDWVPSHTSVEHPWFQASRSSRDDDKRDWYIWRDPKPDGGPPTNWISVFGGSTWEWDERTRQCYLHTFLPEQPDLNWRHPAVRGAVHDAMRFWRHRGVDGFRLDAASWLIKDDQFRDNPPNPDYDAARHAPDEQLLPTYTREQPQVHEIMQEIRRVADEQPDALLLGEIYAPVEHVMAYHGDPTRPELHLPLNMGFAWHCWNADTIGAAIEEVYKHLPAHGWPAWLLSGHDRSRLAWRTQGEQTRNAALLLCTLRGTPVVYYGEEIGMRGVPIPANEARDPQGRRIGRNRDPERTPMQWNRDANAGFTKGVPWLPVGADAASANVADQGADPHSLLSLYRRLLELRSSDDALRDGDFEMVSHVEPLVAYWRTLGDRRLLIALNFSGEPQEYDIPGELAETEVVLSTFLDRDHESVGSTINLRAQEGVIVAVKKGGATA